MILTIAVEGVPDHAVAAALLCEVGLVAGPVHVTYGKARLDRQLNAYNNAARFGPWFVLRDLNSDALCAAALRHRLLPQPSSGMCFRAVVREIEAWLLADDERFAAYFHIVRALLPANPDGLTHPKEETLRLVRRSKSRDIRVDMLPRPGSGAKVGPAYNSRLAEFARDYWQPTVACLRSESLRRCRYALRRIGRS